MHSPFDVPRVLNDIAVEAVLQQARKAGVAPDTTTSDAKLSPAEVVIPLAQEFVEWLPTHNKDTDFCRNFMDRKTVEAKPEVIPTLLMGAFISFLREAKSFDQLSINLMLKSTCMTEAGF